MCSFQLNPSSLKPCEQGQSSYYNVGYMLVLYQYISIILEQNCMKLLPFKLTYTCANNTTYNEWKYKKENVALICAF